MKKEKKGSILREIVIDILLIFVVLIVARLITTYVGQQTIVQGRSMETTLHDGDRVITNKIGYRFSNPKRFDVIVLKYPHDQKTYYVKRIIALPGESVRIDEAGQIFVNGSLLEENFGKEKIENPGRAYQEIILGEDEYFVLGDNRNHSQDSRSEDLGNVHRSQIIGEANLRIYPFNQMGYVK